MQPRLLINVLDGLVAASATAAVWGASLISSLLSGTTILALQTSPETQLPGETAFVRWAIEQGGLVIAILVILWFYRKDFRSMDDDRKQYDQYQQATQSALMKLVEDNTKAMQQLTAAIDDAQNERFPPRRQLPNGR